MKKITALLLSLLLLLTFAACGSNSDHDHDHDHDEATTAADSAHSHNPSGVSVSYTETLDMGIREYFSEAEDTQYHDLFFNDNASKYENKSFEKYGTFAVIYDAYNGKDRYYVWGYGSEEKDCCFQWEFVMPEGSEIPVRGSYIKVSGKMTHSDDALDKYWLTDVTLSVEEAAEKTDFDYDFTTLSPTLMRVQAINMLQKGDSFKEASIRICGTAKNEVTISPIDGSDSWSFHFAAAKDHLDAGTEIIIEGIFNKADAQNIITPSVITAKK